jgi:beta-glucosidase
VGFARVSVLPDEVVTVQVAFDVQRAFGHWDTAQTAWALEATDWVLHVGTSSRDTPLEARISAS